MAHYKWTLGILAVFAIAVVICVLYALDSPTNPPSLAVYAGQNDFQKVEKLLAQGANIDELCFDAGYCPLTVAAMNLHPEMVQFLLDKGANVHGEFGTPIP